MDFSIIVCIALGTMPKIWACMFPTLSLKENAFLVYGVVYLYIQWRKENYLTKLYMAVFEMHVCPSVCL